MNLEPENIITFRSHYQDEINRSYLYGSDQSVGKKQPFFTVYTHMSEAEANYNQ
jgi:hypothetical protein